MLLLLKHILSELTLVLANELLVTKHLLGRMDQSWRTLDMLRRESKLLLLLLLLLLMKEELLTVLAHGWLRLMELRILMCRWVEALGLFIEALLLGIIWRRNLLVLGIKNLIFLDIGEIIVRNLVKLLRHVLILGHHLILSLQSVVLGTLALLSISMLAFSYWHIIWRSLSVYLLHVAPSGVILSMFKSGCLWGIVFPRRRRTFFLNFLRYLLYGRNLWLRILNETLVSLDTRFIYAFFYLWFLGSLFLSLWTCACSIVDFEWRIVRRRLLFRLIRILFAFFLYLRFVK